MDAVALEIPGLKSLEATGLVPVFSPLLADGKGDCCLLSSSLCASLEWQSSKPINSTHYSAMILPVPIQSHGIKTFVFIQQTSTPLFYYYINKLLFLKPVILFTSFTIINIREICSCDPFSMSSRYNNNNELNSLWRHGG